MHALFKDVSVTLQNYSGQYSINESVLLLVSGKLTRTVCKIKLNKDLNKENVEKGGRGRKGIL